MVTSIAMQTLSVIQPWVEAMVLLLKCVENRQRSDGRMPALCAHRGPLLLHASKSVGTREDFDGAVEWMRRIVDEKAREKIHDFAEVKHARGFGREIWFPKDTMRLGGIVAVCDVVGHVDPLGRVWTKPHAMTTTVLTPSESPWHQNGSFGLLLRNVRRVPQFYACLGARQLFDTDPFLVGLREDGQTS